MQPISAPLFVLLCLITLYPNAGYSYQQGTISQCQRIQDRIDRYTDKRRQGGSKAQMKRWQKSRNQAHSDYGRLNCKSQRRYLK